MHYAVTGMTAEPVELVEESGIKGGLVVHVGCGDGKLTAGLRVNDSYLVHGLDTDAKNVAKAREHIHSKGLYGPVSVDVFDGKGLPYVDNLVNLIVADALSGVTMKEVMRVLAPRGVAYVNGKKTVPTTAWWLLRNIFSGSADLSGAAATSTSPAFLRWSPPAAVCSISSMKAPPGS